MLSNPRGGLAGEAAVVVAHDALLLVVGGLAGSGLRPARSKLCLNALKRAIYNSMIVHQFTYAYL